MSPIQIQSPGLQVRSLQSSDFWHLRRLEHEVWGGDATGELCPHYLRLCTELYPEWCFLALDGERPVGYVLNFPSGKTAYCATLAVHPDYQKGRANYLLIRAMVSKLVAEGMEECRFLVEPDNADARSVHQSLGARVVAEVDDYYRKGDKRLWSVINREDMERIRARYSRLRLVS
ncbi:MAG: alanine acetyltransferase [Holophagaceae bacterium]|nr:alanine acetyltransferase [Holophagaceae bacterium]